LKYCEITADEIQIQHLIQQVQDRHCGAISLFMGTVREFTHGKRTLYLEYSAYEKMAIQSFNQIADEVLSQFACSHIAIVHRIGRLEIGEVAVAIVVSSPHRDAAFKGCRHAIEQIKKFVPIWKKEVGEESAYWVGTQEVSGEEK
jgi:molybdopterin synthase catalytic subunit